MNSTRFKLLVPLCLLSLWITSCAVGPDYKEPELEMPDAWAAAVEEEVSQEDPSLEKWWEAFEDTVLISLIKRGELSNLDLASAVARVAEARALRGITKGDFYPQIALDAAYSRSQISENGQSGAFLPEGTTAEPVDYYQVGFDATWELDVFGRVRRNVEASTADLEASVEDYRDVLVTLYAEIAANYVDVRTLQLRLDFAEQNAESQRQSVGLTRDRYEAGLTSELDVAQAESNLGETEARIPQLQTMLVAAMNRLAVLLGTHPGTLNAELSMSKAIPPDPEGLTVGLPADLLRRRPDVRRAERQLAARTARIGVATAQLYPFFSLDGFLTQESFNTSNLFDGSSTSWSLIPGLKWNIFRGGKIRNQIRAEEARTQQALLSYESAVLRALEEVENAVVAYDRERVRKARLTEAVSATERSVELVNTQYTSGLTNFQSYLDAQRSLFNQQDQLAVSQGQVIKNLIALNKALGGGWAQTKTEDPDNETEQSEATNTVDQSNEGE